MQKFHLITEKHSKHIMLKISSKNTAAFSIRILKSSKENNVKRCTKSRFFAFLINAAVFYITLDGVVPHPLNKVMLPRR